MAGTPDRPLKAAGPRRERRSGIDRAGLRADLRAAVPDATAGLAVTALVYWLLYARIRSGESPTLEVMPFLADAGTYWMYWLCQAFGWSGLLWAWITVMLGLVRSTARPGWSPVPVARIERWHRTTSLTSIGLMFGHAFMFFAELVRADEHGLGWGGRVGRAFVDAFVPGGYATGTGQVAILIGLIAFYLSIPLGLSFYYRATMGPRLWTVLHRFIIVVYALSVWHTLLYGTNVWFDGAFRTLVWTLQLPVAALLLVRLLAPARRADRLVLRDPAARPPLLPLAARLAGRAAAAAAVVVLLAVTASGRDGGRTPGAESGDPAVTQAMVWWGLGALLLAIAAAAWAAVRAGQRRRGAAGRPHGPGTAASPPPGQQPPARRTGRRRRDARPRLRQEAADVRGTGEPERR